MDSTYITTDIAARQIGAGSFQLLHQLVGVLLGEHLDQLLTVIYTIMVSYAFIKLKIFPAWISWLGIIISAIYFLAQADLFATVIPGFPVVPVAGYIGSTLWLIWLIVTGILFLRIK